MSNPMQTPGGEPRNSRAARPQDESYTLNQRPSRRGIYTVIAVIVMLTVAALFARGEWLRLTNVQVNGLITYKVERVLEQAGITESTTYFGLNEERIKKNIEDDRYLRFISMEKLWPNGLILNLEERQPRINVVYMSIQYIAAADGMVLETTNDIKMDNGCIQVTGLTVRDIRRGGVIACRNEAQMEAMRQVIGELEAQGALDEISELNFSSLDSIFLVTVDGYTANIGDVTELRAKIGTVRGVLQELRGNGSPQGTIEAATPGIASFRPIN